MSGLVINPLILSSGQNQPSPNPPNLRPQSQASSSEPRHLPRVLVPQAPNYLAHLCVSAPPLQRTYLLHFPPR